jgi:hypothetical protein
VLGASSAVYGSHPPTPAHAIDFRKLIGRNRRSARKLAA